MWLIDRAMSGLAGQLGEPSGVVGGVVGRLLNRGNRSIVTAAVDAIDTAAPGVVVADIGFGGGVGLDLLLRRVDASGSVHGVELSATMLADARRRFSDDIAAGRLVLHDARVESLPLDDASVDAIISTNTIYFIEDLAAAVGEIVRVLRPTGRLVLGVGDPAQMTKMPFTQHGFRLRPIEEVIGVLRQAGFADVEDRRLSADPGAFHLLVCDVSADGISRRQ